MNKFEKLIEYIINDEDQKARELFHDIVVEKSRDIYESIMDEESMEETVHGEETVEDLVDEVGNEEAHMEDEGSEEEFDLDHEEGDEVAGDFPADEHGDSGEEHEEIEDKVMNIDAKLDELLAKFDEIMGDEGHDEMGAEHGEEPEMFEAMSGKSGKSGSGVMEAEEAGSGSAKSGKSGKSGSGSAKSGKSGKPFESRANKSTSEIMREYVDKIGEVYGGQGDANEGDAVGAAGKKTAVNTKPGSVGPGNDFGGDANMAHGGNQNQDGTSPTKASNEYTKGEGKLIGNVGNTPGGDKKLKSTGDEYSKEHPADGKLAGDDGSVPQNTKSVQKQNTGKK